MSKAVAFFLLSFMVLFFSCELDNTRYSEIPEIEFKSISVVDTVNVLGNKVNTVKLHFYLIDGDGNIGPIYKIDCVYAQPNCFIDLFFKNDAGIFVEDTTVAYTLKAFTIPDVGDLGQDKRLKADIFIDIEYLYQLKNFYSTIFYQVQVMDKSLNNSNVINTDTLMLP